MRIWILMLRFKGLKRWGISGDRAGVEVGWLNNEVNFKTNSTISQENGQLQIYLSKSTKWFHFIACAYSQYTINLIWDVLMYNNVIVHAWRHVYIWDSATPALAVVWKLGQMSIHKIYFVSLVWSYVIF